MTHWALADIPDDAATIPRRWFHHGEQMLALLERYQPQVTVEHAVLARRVFVRGDHQRFHHSDFADGSRYLSEFSALADRV